MDSEGVNKQFARNIILTSTSCVPRIIRIKSWSVVSFFKLIDEELVDFFDDDRCCKIADKYLIAMVFTYFLRAALRPEEYTRSNFFIALYLAHDMEEDRDDARMLLRDYVGLDDSESSCSPASFFEGRDEFWRRMHHRGAVSKLCCDKVMQMIMPFHKIWSRQRHVNHSGALRDHRHSKEDTCPNCLNKTEPQYSITSSEFSPEVIYGLRRPTISNGQTLNPNYNFDFE